MKNNRRVILSVLLWIGFPMVISALQLLLNDSRSLPASSMLVIFYHGFSWSIACLIFIVETSRQQLFRQISPYRASLRLAIYALLASALVFIAIPQSTLLTAGNIILNMLVAAAYGGIMGFVYQQTKNADGI